MTVHKVNKDGYMACYAKGAPRVPDNGSKSWAKVTCKTCLKKKPVNESINRGQRLRQLIAKRRKKSQADQFRIKEGQVPTFIDFLLVELQITDQDLRDPKKKQELMRLMRSDDKAAQPIVQRAERKQVRDTRTALQQEQDPRKAALRRKRIALMKQIAKIDTDLNATTLQQQQQANQQPQSTL